MKDTTDVCLTITTGEKPLGEHLKSLKHEKKVQEFNKSDNSLGWNDDPFISFVGMCTLCRKSLNKSQLESKQSQIEFYSTKQFEDHLASEDHRKNVQNYKKSIENIEKRQGFYTKCVGMCKLCESPLNTADQIKSHIGGKMHIRKLQSKY